MKNFVWILLLQISITALIPKADLGQLSLLGNILAHFNEFHAGKDHGSGLFSFVDFLVEHYGNMDHEHPDEDEHRQLPFKDFSSGNYFVIVQTQISLVMPTSPLQSQSFWHLDGLCPKGFRSSIDHPPSV